MADYDNNNRGALWPNREKASDTHADFTGTINVDGVEYFLNGWKRKPDASDKAPSLSVSVKRKDKQPNASAAHTKTNPASNSRGSSDDMNDDIPF